MKMRSEPTQVTRAAGVIGGVRKEPLQADECSLCRVRAGACTWLQLGHFWLQTSVRIIAGNVHCPAKIKPPHANLVSADTALSASMSL